MSLPMEQKQTHRGRNRLVVAKREGWGRRGLRVWDSQMQVYDKNNKALLCSTGNCIQYPEKKNHDKGEENIWVCVWPNHLAVQ